MASTRRPERQAARGTAADRPDIAHARALLAAGRLDEARAILEQALARAPRDAEAAIALAEVHVRAARPVAAIRLVRAALRSRPTDARAHGTLGAALQMTGDHEGALLSFERATALEPGSADAWCGLAQVHERMHRLDAAARALDRAIAAAPDSPAITLYRARVLRRAGESERAAGILAEIVRSHPGSPHAAAALTETAHALDAAGRTDEAAETFRRAKAIHLAAEDEPDRNPLDAALPSIRLLHAMDADRAARWRESAPGDAGAGHAFLVGFPRSGTTLLEQVLAAHPRVRTTDESDLIAALAGAIHARRGPGGTPDIRTLDALSEADVRDLATAYRRAAEERFGPWRTDQILLDKMPLNSVSLPEIARVFPRSRVLFALRDPRDVVLSCYMQLGGPTPNARFYLTVERIARFYAVVLEGWLAFREHAPVPWLEVRYEDVVDDLEAQARRVLGFLGLPWDARVLSFPGAGRLVASPTYERVAAGVDRRAVGRWRRYPDLMAEALPILAPLVERLGYQRE